jgi:hypothetical protein
MFALLSVPLNPRWAEFARDNPAFAWWMTLVGWLWIGTVLAIVISLHFWRIRRFWHRHFTADGRQVAQRLREVVR